MSAQITFEIPETMECPICGLTMDRIPYKTNIADQLLVKYSCNRNGGCGAALTVGQDELRRARA